MYLDVEVCRPWRRFAVGTVLRYWTEGQVATVNRRFPGTLKVLTDDQERKPDVRPKRRAGKKRARTV